MKRERISRYFPARHQKVFVSLIADILKIGLTISPPRRISSSEAQQLSDLIFLETDALFSGKQLQKYAEEISDCKGQIVKPRPGTLNLLAQFRDWKKNSKPAIVNKNILNQYWILYLQSHLTKNKQFNSSLDNNIDEDGKLNQEHLEFEEISEDIEPTKIESGQVEFFETLPEKKNAELILVRNYILHESPKEMSDMYDMYVLNKFDIYEINRRHKFASLLGGAMVGVINALLLILLPPIITGYVTVQSGDKTLLSALITCTNIMCGSIGGYLVCGFFGKPMLFDKYPVINWKEKTIIIILSSIIMIVFRQLASRVFIEKRIFDTSIDLETICYCITSSIGIIGTIRLMKSNYIIELPELMKAVASTTLKVLLALTFFVSVYIFFIQNSVIDKTRLPAHSLFQIVIDFPQSGRIILVSLMNLLNMCIWAIVRNIYYRLP